MSETLQKEPVAHTATRPAGGDPLQQARDELARVKAQLHRTHRLASLGTAAAKLAHEFNNAMTPIVGYARYALESGDPELMAKALRTTIDQSDTVLGMAERILGMSVETPIVYQSVGLRGVVQGAVDGLYRDLSKDGITLKIDIDDAMTVRADAKQLKQVFFNLLLNARDALKIRRGRISVVAASTTGDTVEIRFADNGCGIDAEHLVAFPVE